MEDIDRGFFNRQVEVKESILSQVQALGKAKEEARDDVKAVHYSLHA
jgi:hypothetical protein